MAEYSVKCPVLHRDRIESLGTYEDFVTARDMFSHETGALFHTQGGLRVDAHARVQRRDGSAIAGLYASGGAAMGISGHGAAGYLAGNGLLPALGLALLAAEDLAASATVREMNHE